MVALFQFGLHAVSHLVDIDKAHPGWVGLLEFAGLALATGVLGWLLARASRAVGGR